MIKFVGRGLSKFIGACGIVVALINNGAYAQGGPPPSRLLTYNDIATAGSDSSILALDNDLLGDQIDLASGTLSFYHTDVSIPGNSNLPVKFSRYINDDHRRIRHLETWAIDIPHVYTRLARGRNWDNDRCSDPAKYFARNSPAYLGIKLHTSGAHGKPLIEPSTNSSYSSAHYFGNDFLDMTTIDFWRVECRSGGAAGEYFEATSPKGTIYKFNKFYRHDAGVFRNGINGSIHADTMAAYPTEIVDVHGNWVKYEYNDSAKGPSKIFSNDGRQIDISYNSNGQVSQVTANNRNWYYTYSSAYYIGLQKVTLPDNRYWEFTNMRGVIFSGDSCPSDYSGASLKHPSGVVGTFNTTKIINFRADVPGPIGGSARKSCLDAVQQASAIDGSANYFSVAVTLKRLGLPGGTTYSWAYDYDEGDMWDPNPPTNPNGLGNSIGPTPTSLGGGNYRNSKLRTTTEPDGTVVKSWFGRSFIGHAGKLMKREVFANSGAASPMRSETYDYGGVGFTAPYNSSGPAMGNPYTPIGINTASVSNPTYLNYKEIKQDGDVFLTTYDHDKYGGMITTSTTSNIATLPRVTTTVYDHKKPKWILGLPKKVTINAREMSASVYDAKGQATSQTRYGQPFATFGYNTDGTVAWVKDALQRQTQARSWKRGTPQQIIRPDNKSVYQYVDNNGWLTSTKDAKLQTTTYTRDNMGRLTVYDPPIQNSTTISYSFGAQPTQTITKGGRVETITYDSLFRPILANVNNQIYTRNTYDAAGRTTFTSFPSATSTAPKGTTFTYDGLGRSKTQTTDAGTTRHFYYSSHRHTVLDPAGQSTHYYSTGYGGPGSTDYRFISEGNASGIVRRTSSPKNVWGELVNLRQYGDLGGVTRNKIQYFYYNAARQLCRHRVLETGDTVYKYDAAGQMTSYQAGLPAGGHCPAPTGANKVTLTYDTLGRPTKTDFASASTPDILRTYDDNSNVKTVNRNGVNWTYGYNALNALTSESLAIDGKTYGLGYLYNTNGYMTRRTLPSGRQVNMTYDALGRQTAVKNGTTNLASGITYHPNGMAKALTYGNGQAYSKTLNALLQPTRVTSVKGGIKAFDRAYTYTPRGKIASISDYVDSSYNQTFAYDGLGQLTNASGKWGAGSFKYDSLGNIFEKKLGARTVAMTYDTAKNRLSSYTDTTGSNKSLTYDARGNVTTLGAQHFTYDLSNQPTGLSGAVSGSYVYDGNLKRVKSVVGGVTIYNVYDASGALVHIDDLGTGGKTDYVAGAGMSLARIKNNVITYLHPDHLGSAASGTSSSGAVLWQERYTPFGEALIDNTANDNQAGFTGHIKDKATGLNYMQARYYDPVIGRFLSNDPVGFLETGQTGMFNRYSYVLNDPVNMIDPDGQQVRTCAGCGISKKILKATAEVVVATDDFKRNYQDMRDANTIGADKFFHCKANCEATRRGGVGETTAKVISDVRELVDRTIKGDPAEASEKDQVANNAGRQGAKANQQNTCSNVCSDFIPNGLSENYTEGEPSTAPTASEEPRQIEREE